MGTRGRRLAPARAAHVLQCWPWELRVGVRRAVGAPEQRVSRTEGLACVCAPLLLVMISSAVGRSLASAGAAGPPQAAPCSNAPGGAPPKLSTHARGKLSRLLAPLYSSSGDQQTSPAPLRASTLALLTSSTAVSVLHSRLSPEGEQAAGSGSH